MGCDLRLGRKKTYELVFQFAHLREVRLCLNLILYFGLSFQFTHLHEVRPEIVCVRIGDCRFNSRTFARCDGIILVRSMSIICFNSRTQVGAIILILIIQTFNSRPHKSATSPCLFVCCADKYFNSRTHKSATLPRRTLNGNFVISIHALIKVRLGFMLL